MIPDVIVTSKNFVKFDAAQQAFAAYFNPNPFHFISLDADSGIPDQPWGKEQTQQGAENRILDARKKNPNAAYYVSIESGLLKEGQGRVYVINACAIADPLKIHFNWASTFELHPDVAKLVLTGMELSSAFEHVYGSDAHKTGKGGIGHLTRENITRTDLYVHTLKLTLIPFVNQYDKS